MSHPRVSILIPNYNNGVQSSIDGKTDLLGDLLDSLHATLKDDPTPLEIIAFDDGSTDDSLGTLKAWAEKTWRNGEPFLKLLAEPHCGVLAKTANKLVEASQGEILCRLDGDIQIFTPNWVQKLCTVFDDGPPDLGVVGPKQLRPDGKIHSFGDWLLHPCGYHHVAAGLERDAMRWPMEVDHVMGCFYCCKREVHDALEGYDEQFLRGQTIDFGLRARLKGYRCIAVPHIEFVHRHGLRKGRATRADTAEGIGHTIDIFRKKWGFCRIAPDLDVVRERYRGTPLLWNAAVFGIGPGEADRPLSAPPSVEQSDWGRYASNDAFRQAIDVRVAVAAQVAQQIGGERKCLVVGGRAGLFPHLLTKQGFACTGVERDAALIELGQQCVARGGDASSGPELMHQSDPTALPVEPHSYPLVLLFDLLERHENPVGLLRQAWEAAAPGGHLVILTARPGNRAPAPWEAERRMTMPQVINLLHATGQWQSLSDPAQDKANQPVIVVARAAPAQ